MAIHSRAYLDAIRNEDKEGQREALFAMSRTLETERKRREPVEKKTGET